MNGIRSAVLAALAFAAGATAPAAFAETFQGRVSAVDPGGRMLVLEQDAEPPRAVIRVAEDAQFTGGVASLEELRPGHEVRLDVERREGAWEADSVQAAGDTALVRQTSADGSGLQTAGAAAEG